MMTQEAHITTWLDNVPVHWHTLRIKNIFTEIDERSETGTEELLSVSHYTGVTKKKDSLGSETDFISNAKTLVGYKKVTENDLASNIMLAWNGSLGISKYNGITSPAYCVYRIKGDNNPHYFGYLFSTTIMKAEFRKKSFGIIDSRLRLYSDKFFSIPVAVPPKAEQDQIVAYIKDQSKKIKHFIKKKQEFIALLKEQRQAVINKAFKPNKNSNWKNNRLKFFTKRIGDGLHGTPEYVNSSFYKFINGNNLRNGNIYIDKDTNSVSIEEFEKYDLKLVEGSILYSINGTIGNSAFYKGEKIVLGKSAAYIEPKYSGNELDFNYLYHYLNTDMVMIYFLEATASTTIKNLSLETLRNMPIAYPIDKQEQAQIVSHIKTETAKIDQAIAKAEREIELIAEYKEAMIAEAVLGKINHKVVNLK